jgi:hypothetical protein
MANGAIAIYDISRPEESALLFRSEINEYFHIDRVTSLEWIPFKLAKGMKLVSHLYVATLLWIARWKNATVGRC